MAALCDEDATLVAKSPAAIKMPNRDGFTGDARPDVKKSCLHEWLLKIPAHQHRVQDV